MLPARLNLLLPTYVPEARAFFDRAGNLSAQDRKNYGALIRGLILDGVWSKFDALYILAAPDTTTALLNLVQNTFNLTANGSPTFTAYQGYVATETASPTDYLDTGFVPSTAGGNYTLNDAHYSYWSNTDNTATAAQWSIGTNITPGPPNAFARSIAKHTDGKAYLRINDNGESAGVATATSNGFYTAVRTGSSAQKGYKNASDLSITSVASGVLSSFSFFLLANNNAGTAAQGSNRQLSQASIGASLTQTQVTALYNRIGTFRTAVGL